MKADKTLILSGAMLLVWSMQSDAHSSHEAMQNGGSLLRLTAALLHPLLESPYLSALVMGSLVIMLLIASRRLTNGIKRMLQPVFTRHAK